MWRSNPQVYLQRFSHFFLAGLALMLLAACSPAAFEPLPTTALAPALPPAIDATTAPLAPATRVVDIVTAVAPISAEIVAATPVTPTPAPPTPSSIGLRPGEIAGFVQPSFEVDPEAAVDWRPPPVPVPHSLHPDDHYWLSRPIPSGRRNYDLEWYPYGSEPLLATALPYRVHHGIDFPNETGTPILAATSGMVIHAGPLPSPRDGVNYYGNTVIIWHDWQWQGRNVYTLYAHTLELFVEVGDYVQQGQLIAGVGASGEVSGPHLHLEVRVGQNSYNHTRNPLLWLAPYEGWGTLAGRFVDRQNRSIQGATITVIPHTVNTTRRTTRTYMSNLVNSDEIWNENFVVADLPAGRYEVLLNVADRTFRRIVELKPGQTNFIVVQADFVFVPTATPSPTSTATPTATPTATVEP
jgi:murein DD-endopeptidase MepM/ murein hydrolase activator NlpD